MTLALLPSPRPSTRIMLGKLAARQGRSTVHGFDPVGIQVTIQHDPLWVGVWNLPGALRHAVEKPGCDRSTARIPDD